MRQIGNVESMHVRFNLVNLTNQINQTNKVQPAQPDQPDQPDQPADILAFVFFRGQTVGKYKILSPLGSGGFGTVYLAQDTWLDKKVAIKVPHRQQNLDFGELLHEPRLLGSLSHPNIVSVLTAEKQEGLFFIVMEYVAGETLETVIMREGAVELTRALDFAVQIANAVDYAHRQNVIHRDLRPGNVLISEQGLVKVADFGTSRVLEIAAHGTTVIGSPPYMAPEQFHGKAVFASDLYSLGITMYQMLTGVLPVRHAVAGRARQVDDRRTGVAAPRAQSQAAQGGQRDRHEGAGPRHQQPLSACRRSAGRHHGPGTRDGFSSAQSHARERNRGHGDLRSHAGDP